MWFQILFSRLFCYYCVLVHTEKCNFCGTGGGIIVGRYLLVLSYLLPSCLYNMNQNLLVCRSGTTDLIQKIIITDRMLI